MNEQMNDTNSWTERIKNNTILLFWWTAAWTVTMAVATFGPKFIWHSNYSLTILVIFINMGIGFGMILANKRHLKALDEMQQKIQLEAMALTLGAGLVVGLSYSTLDITNIISFDAEIAHLVIFMGLTYLAGIIVSQFRYR